MFFFIENFHCFFSLNFSCFFQCFFLIFSLKDEKFFDKRLALSSLLGCRAIIASEFVGNLKKALYDEGVVFKYDKKIERIEKNTEGIYVYYRREKIFFDYLIYGYSPYFINGIAQIMQKTDPDLKASIKTRPPRDMLNFSNEILEDLSFFKHLGFFLFFAIF